MKTEDHEYWIDQKGRHILVHTMSYGWLNNIKRSSMSDKRKQPILDELKRRKQLMDKSIHDKKA